MVFDLGIACVAAHLMTFALSSIFQMNRLCFLPLSSRPARCDAGDLDPRIPMPGPYPDILEDLLGRTPQLT